MGYKYRPNNNFDSNNGNVLFPIILIVFGAISGLSLLMPLGVFLLIYNSQKSDSGYTKTYRPKTKAPKHQDFNFASERQGRVPLVKYSTRQMKMINDRLKDYFKDHEELLVMDEVNLRLKNQHYRSLNSLNVFRYNDYVSSLAEFGYQYPQTYNQILRLLLSFAMDDEPLYKQKTKESDTASEIKASKNEQEARATAFIATIDELNIAIPDEEISNGLYESCALLKQIKMIEETFVSSHEKLDKLYDYYLPILINILNQYKDLEKTQNNEKFKQTKEKLLKTIILINDAMKTLSATLCEDDIINLSADISTLEAILKKDGLVGEGIMKRNAGAKDE
ncbi:MAG: hypothetical protein MR210_03880 [Erysipelotrichaceae bacterium]|nr:hypothetical protein [Erysipelotrichaceae bacterium]MDY5251253.1 hypothetical protein [Erysipelotrichaceae bacterium]